MNARTKRALVLTGAAFCLIRNQGTIFSEDETIILWAHGTAGLSGRLYTSGPRVTLEIWTKECVLAVSRITGTADCDVLEYQRGAWETKLLDLASKPAPVH